MTAPGTVFYEVNADMEPSLEGEYAGWLKKHIGDMLKVPGFLAATTFRQTAADDGLPNSARARFTVHYEVASSADLNRYLQELAPTMRAEGLAKFGNRITYSRRILLFQERSS